MGVRHKPLHIGCLTRDHSKRRIALSHAARCSKTLTVVPVDDLLYKYIFNGRLQAFLDSRARISLLQTA